MRGNKKVNRKLFLSFLLTISMLTGCSNKDKEKKISKEQLEQIALQYGDYFDQYKVNHYYSEYFMTCEELSNVIEKQDDDLICNFVNDDDVFSLESKIKANSLEFLAKNDVGISPFCNYFEEDSSSSKEMNELKNDRLEFELALTSVLKNLLNNSSNDIDEDICKMQTLKIVYSDTFVDDESIIGAYIADQNVIYLCRSNIKNYVKNYYPYNYRDVLYATLRHEINHMRQHRCDCRVTDSTVYEKISYDADVVTMFMESSAESEIYNFGQSSSSYYLDTWNNSFDYTYYDERGQESIFMLLALFNEEVTADDYYNAIFDSDIVSLFDFFDCKTDKDRYTLYKLLCTNDAFFVRNFLIADICADGNDSGDVFVNLEKEFLIEIFRVCLSRAVEYTSRHDDFSLEDNLMIFNVIKDEIAFSLSLLGNLDMGVLKNLEGKYIAFLSAYYDIKVDKIRQIEEDVCPSYGDFLNEAVNGKFSIHLFGKNYEEKATSLLKKFPVLKNIIFNCNLDGYDITFNDTNVKKLVIKEK